MLLIGKHFKILVATKLTNRQNYNIEVNQLEIKNKPILEKGGPQNQNCKTNTENTS